MSEAHNRAVAKYMETRKKLAITVSKETYEDLKAKAESSGNSMQAFIIACLKESTGIAETNYYTVKLPKAKIDELAKAADVSPTDYLKSVTKSLLNPEAHLEQLAKRFLQGR